MLRGKINLLLNKNLPALDDFKQALLLNPLLIDIHLYLGRAHFQNGNLKQALIYVRKEIERFP